MTKDSTGRLSLGQALLRLSPLALPCVALFGGGLALAIAQSFGVALPFPYEGGAFAAYQELTRPHLAGSILLSLWVALASAGLSVICGSILAYAIWRLPNALQRWTIIYKTPLILPPIAVGFLAIIFLSRSGVLSSLAFHIGLVDTPADFPSILYGGWGGGIILAYLYKETPFVVLLSLAALRRLDPGLVQTAHMFHASRATIFRTIILPHLAPVLHTVFIILFLYSFGAFDIPYLVGESSPGMLSVEAFNLYFKRTLADRPTAMALLTLMFLFSVGFIVIYTRTASRLGQKERKL
ncbi:ABC transporter permease [Oceanidesulfovibrio marinus]|uniref:Sugar ABC transporter permease n=1 Tax=Oceanidesulfovibrio marinus TaxID=370038 RepID=A0A6P1ZGA1_9BACT|nr:ABC transporter permease subunit [Oceanidesulfovibrio marinus]QJT07801.1 sugar ABC transporter permease [Oceanidesulfovibrio marinus]TVM33300.1 sugar ABC transporter permease [Oceanidesulfovibrio marinus]